MRRKGELHGEEGRNHSFLTGGRDYYLMSISRLVDLLPLKWEGHQVLHLGDNMLKNDLYIIF